MEYSGCGQEAFTAKAIDEIHKSSMGIPRMINRICEKALLYAYRQQKRLVDDYMIKFVVEHELLAAAEDIQEALKDLLGSTLKGMMEAEMDDHLGYEKSERVDRDEVTNYRNGTKKKRINSSFGGMVLRHALYLATFEATNRYASIF